MEIPRYPINDFGPLMTGLVIGGLGIFHVFLAQFAIGGGMLMCYFQHISAKTHCALTRGFVDGYFKVLVLVSFVAGAVTGVGMWLTSIQVSPRTIGLMVDEFHWIWAIEWTFFCLEVAAGYCFYRYGPKLDDRTRLTLLGLYTVGAWFSLFWINGILSWQLTPGRWIETTSVWSGFFNPGFWPSLLFRTVTCMTIASLVACVVINIMPDLSREQRTTLINSASHLLTPMLIMPLLGLWFFSVVPEDSRAWATGGSPAMTMFLTGAVGCSALIGGYAILGLFRQKLYINGATATLLTALAFGATAGGEFVREGIRKPFTVRQILYSNAIARDEVEHLREVGCTTDDPFPLKNLPSFPNPQLETGMKVYRVQCSICHTLDGANALSHLMESWSADQKRLNVAQLQRTKTYMPPFAGTAEEVEAVVQFISWHVDGRPDHWDESHADDVIVQIQEWLDEVGTEPVAMVE